MLCTGVICQFYHTQETVLSTKNVLFGCKTNQKKVLITVEKCGRLAAIAPKDFPQPHLGKDEERKEEVEDDELQVWGGEWKEGSGERR